MCWIVVGVDVEIIGSNVGWSFLWCDIEMVKFESFVF